MKLEIEKILEMHKSGTISSEQASALLEELSAKEGEDESSESEDHSHFGHGHSHGREHGHRHFGHGHSAHRRAAFGETLMEKFATKMAHFSGGPFLSSHVEGFQADELRENRFIASKIEGPRGKEYLFKGNSVTACHLADLEFHRAEFKDNKLVSTHAEEIRLVDGMLNDSAFTNSHLRKMVLDHASMIKTRIANCEWRDLQLEGDSRIEESEIRSSSLRHFKLEDESLVSKAYLFGVASDTVLLKKSELSDLDLHALGMKNVSFTDSSWIGVIAKALKLKNFKMDRSHFTDVIFSGDNKWSRSGMRDTGFESCHLKKVLFSNCRFDRVTFKNLLLENVQVKDLELRDQVIDGNEAFMKLLARK